MRCPDHAVTRAIIERAGVPVQHFANRSDLLGGSTLGSIATAKVSVPSVDIGLAQLAMHSCMETAVRQDVQALVDAMRVYFGKTLRTSADALRLSDD